MINVIESNGNKIIPDDDPFFEMAKCQVNQHSTVRQQIRFTEPLVVTNRNTVQMFMIRKGRNQTTNNWKYICAVFAGY